MSLYQQGEYRAFEEIYFRHSGRVLGFLKTKLHNPGEAEDLFQQTFLKVHQNRRRYDSTLPFLPWLFSISRNLLIDHLRKQRPLLIETEKLVALADKAQRGESKQPVTWDEVINLLPDAQRRIIKLRFEEGMSFEEIAHIHGTSEVSARKRLSRTVQGLRQILKPKGGE